MPKGGTLKVITKKASPNGDKGKAEEGYVRVIIKDTGCGIAEEHLSKVFDPFFSTKDDGERTGLGLSVSYGIIEEHGGTITIDSRVNGGTTVNVWLPQRNRKRPVLQSE